MAASGLISLSPALLAQTPAPADTNAPAVAPNPVTVPLLTALSATTISGYVDTSAVWNPGTGNANPAPYAFNAGKQDGFNLNSVDIKISKVQDETGWSAGYTAELSYGPDAQSIDGGAYPIRQAYVALHMPVGNGIDWQLGRWDNLLGYEVSDSVKNPNYTRSYGYSFEPTEHTGLLGSYKVCDAVNLQAGVADTINTLGLNSRTDPGSAVIESKKSVVSLVTITAPTNWGSFGGSALYVGFDYGEGNSGGVNSVNSSTGHDRQEMYIGATINTPVKDLTFGAAWDWIHHFDVVNGLGSTIDTRYVDAVSAYGSYKLTDKLTLNGRAEYANGPGLTGLLFAADGEAPGSGGSGNDFNKVIALTGTLQYDLWANVISRVEVRWDHAADGSAPFGGTVVGTGAKVNEVMLAANVIYKF
ncbi:MAG: outer membrane beta-barrel protein [Limisphaerales bacterium]